MKTSRIGQRDGLNAQAQDKVGKAIKRVYKASVEEETVKLMDVNTSKNPARPTTMEMKSGSHSGRPPIRPKLLSIKRRLHALDLHLSQGMEIGMVRVDPMRQRTAPLVETKLRQRN